MSGDHGGGPDQERRGGGGHVPTGVALTDARRQLFDAAERVLLRDGVEGLTSRAVTAEAGCAKGVLHRHFADFDDFLVDLVRDCAEGIGRRDAELRGTAGTGSVVGNLTAALGDVFTTIIVSVLGLTITRDEMRRRLRRDGSPGLPMVREAVRMVAGYLRAEADLGRLRTDTDIDTLAPTLVGAAHLRFADREADLPSDEELQHVVRTVLGAALVG
jgi:AcrR family transcriptional regulator